MSQILNKLNRSLFQNPLENWVELYRRCNQFLIDQWDFNKQTSERITEIEDSIADLGTGKMTGTLYVIDLEGKTCRLKVTKGQIDSATAFVSDGQ